MNQSPLQESTSSSPEPQIEKKESLDEPTAEKTADNKLEEQIKEDIKRRQCLLELEHKKIRKQVSR